MAYTLVIFKLYHVYLKNSIKIFIFSYIVGCLCSVVTGETSESPIQKQRDVINALHVIEQERSGPGFIGNEENEFDFRFHTPNDFSSGFTVNETHLSDNDVKEIIHSFFIEKTCFDENGRLTYVKFQPGEKNLAAGEITEFYITERDEQGNIRKCIVLTTENDTSYGTEALFFKVTDAKLLEFGPYNTFNKPSSISSKAFVLNEKGQKVWTHVKKQTRGFNNEGMLVRETRSETSYSYSRPVGSGPYEVYNVSFFPSGQLKSYDLLSKKALKFPAITEPEHLHISFVWTPKGILLKKLTRKYRITNKTKEYSKGTALSYTLEDPERVVRVEESDFTIVPGTDGLQEVHRIPEKTLITWNLLFNKRNRVLKRRSLETYTLTDGTKIPDKPLRLFRSLKDATFSYDERGRMNGVVVDYYDYTKDGVCSVTRRIEITVLEHDKLGEPAKISLFILTPENPSESVEMTLVQDCSYIINEAAVGNLFQETVDKPYVIHVKTISEKGEILEWELIEKDSAD